MRIINRTAIDETFVRDIAQRAAVLDRDLVLFLDNTTNAMRADHARAKLEEYRQKGWKPLYGWDRDATADNDSHAFTVNKRTIGTQKLPAYVIEAINGYDLLVYIDAMYTKEQGPDLVIALAHEFRHVWQYFNAPVVFHSQTALSWVHPPQETPCELDAERGAKRVLEDLYGPATAREYVNREVAHCPTDKDLNKNLRDRTPPRSGNFRPMEQRGFPDTSCRDFSNSPRLCVGVVHHSAIAQEVHCC